MPAIGEKPVSSRAISRAESLRTRFRDVRDFSKLLTRDLEAEDCVVQSMPDVSPTKWHLAHTTWFFETFVLKKFVTGYAPAIPEYAFLFNSYYNAAGTMHRRDLRGLISRPTVAESFRYREGVDRQIEDLVASASEELLDEVEPIITLGIHHEQQHQELLATDIKHVFAQNPLHPIFRKRAEEKAEPLPPMTFVDFEETIATIGHDGRDFSYDNEEPRHRALVPNFSGARLPTEFEWERAAQGETIEGNFVESERFHPAPATEQAGLRQMFGDIWEWTRSSYSPYPGYRAAPGALGEYNGKFMCNQYVLRGGSCATSQLHIRATYRNFFQPEKRWQFTGLRLARDLE